MTRARRAGVVTISLLAAVTGLIAVPATRARLESDKCRHHAALDAASQARCRTWLVNRRQWWTLGLSHTDAAPRSMGSATCTACGSGRGSNSIARSE
jgi:hypothetical protein